MKGPKPLKKLAAWSYSRHNNYETCPSKIKFSVHDRIKEPPSEPMLRGQKLHKDAEYYLKGKIDIPDMSEEFKYCRKDLEAVKSMEAIAEESWNFRADWTEAADVFAPDVWLRIKVDAYYVDDNGRLVIIDWKTGAIRDGYKAQLELYALGAFKIFGEELQEVEVRNYYIDYAEWRGGEDEGFIYTREKDEARLQKEWEQRIKSMMNDTRFSPTPNKLCNWCFYSKSKGGPCKY